MHLGGRTNQQSSMSSTPSLFYVVFGAIRFAIVWVVRPDTQTITKPSSTNIMCTIITPHAFVAGNYAHFCAHLTTQSDTAAFLCSVCA